MCAKCRPLATRCILRQQDIEAMLADCGPIKRIDLIKTMDKETRVKLSRGFGFVTFALEEDAVKAVQTIHGKRYTCIRSFYETFIPSVVIPL